jgi:MFS family permease
VTEALTAVEPSALARWKWSIAAAFALGGITVSAWGPRLPAIKAELGIDTAAIGLLLAGVTVGAIAGLLLSGAVVHRLGSRRSVAGALLLVAMAMALLGVALSVKSIALLVVGFVAVGVGIGVLDVLINVEGSAVERAAGRTLMPRLHASWSIGVAAGSGIGAAAAALEVAPAEQLIAEAVVIGAAALLLAPGIAPGRRSVEVRSSTSRSARLVQWLRGWLDWRLLLIGVVMLGVELGEGSANSWLTLAVLDDHGQAPAIAALFFTAFAAG